MKQKLTAKIAADYYGVSVAQFINEKDGVFGPLVTIEKNGCGAQMDNITVSYAPWEACQLLLSPLSKISEEHAIEALKLASYHPQIESDWKNIIPDLDVEKVLRFEECIKVKHTLICFIGYFLIGFKDNMALHFEMQDENEEPTSGVWQPHRIVDYLRSVGYDCGHGNIRSLIESGVALDKFASTDAVERSVATGADR